MGTRAPPCRGTACRFCAPAPPCPTRDFQGDRAWPSPAAVPPPPCMRSAPCAFLQSQPRPGKHPDASGSSQGELTHASLCLQTQTCSRGTARGSDAGAVPPATPQALQPAPRAPVRPAHHACTHVWGLSLAGPRATAPPGSWSHPAWCCRGAWGLGAGVLPPDLSLSWANRGDGSAGSEKRAPGSSGRQPGAASTSRHLEPCLQTPAV